MWALQLFGPAYFLVEFQSCMCGLLASQSSENPTCRSLVLFLCAVTLSPVFFHINPSYLGLSELISLSSTQRKCRALFEFPFSPLWPGNCLKQWCRTIIGLTLLLFSQGLLASVSCPMSEKPVFHTLSSIFQLLEDKSRVSYYTLVNSGSFHLNF